MVGLLIFSTLLITADTWEKLAIIYAFIGLLTGASLYSSSCALMMDITNPNIAATEFSVLTSLYNVGEVLIGNATVGAMIAFFGFTGVFLYAGWFSAAALLVLYFIRSNKRVRR